MALPRPDATATNPKYAPPQSGLTLPAPPKLEHVANAHVGPRSHRPGRNTPPQPGKTERCSSDVGLEAVGTVEVEKRRQHPCWVLANWTGKGGFVDWTVMGALLVDWFEKWRFWSCVFCIISFGIICWCVFFLLKGIKGMVSAKSELKLFPKYFIWLIVIRFDSSQVKMIWLLYV